MPDRRRAGLLVLLVLLAGALPLVIPPFDVGALRLGGVSVLWWYVAVVAPIVTVLSTVLALGSSAAEAEAEAEASPREAEPHDADDSGTDCARSTPDDVPVTAAVPAPKS